MSVIVASLCPWPVSIERPHFTEGNVFSLPAVPKGQPPATLEIKDNSQWYKQLSNSPSIRHTILAREIAEDFVLHTAKNGPLMSEGARPAVWICEGQEPSAEEIAVNLAALRAYCALLVEQGDELDRRRTAGEANVPKTTPRMKDAVRFLALKREWITDLVDSSTTCIFCTKTIPMHAIICPECNQVVNRQRYDELKKGKVAEPVPA